MGGAVFESQRASPQLGRVSAQRQRHGLTHAFGRVAQPVVEPYVHPARLAGRPVGLRDDLQLLRLARQHADDRVLGKRQVLALAERIDVDLLLERRLIHRLDLNPRRAARAIAEGDRDPIARAQGLALEPELVDGLPRVVLGEQRALAALRVGRPAQPSAGRGLVSQEVGRLRVGGLKSGSAPHVPAEVVCGGDPQAAAGLHTGFADGEADGEFAVGSDDGGVRTQKLRRARADLDGFGHGFFFRLVGSLGAVLSEGNRREGQGGEEEEALHAAHCKGPRITRGARA